MFQNFPVDHAAPFASQQRLAREAWLDLGQTLARLWLYGAKTHHEHRLHDIL